MQVLIRATVNVDPIMTGLTVKEYLNIRYLFKYSACIDDRYRGFQAISARWPLEVTLNSLGVIIAPLDVS